MVYKCRWPCDRLHPASMCLPCIEQMRHLQPWPPGWWTCPPTSPSLLACEDSCVQLVKITQHHAEQEGAGATGVWTGERPGKPRPTPDVCCSRGSRPCRCWQSRGERGAGPGARGREPAAVEDAAALAHGPHAIHPGIQASLRTQAIVPAGRSLDLSSVVHPHRHAVRW